MRIEKRTLDDLMLELFKELIIAPKVESSRGVSHEKIGALLVLTNPRARISRSETRGKPFSALGELLWYLTGKNDLDFIKYYIPAYEEEAVWSCFRKVIYGGYGPRLFNMRRHNQIKNVIKLLRRKETSRKAVIQLFNAEDISKNYKEIPCTCTLQFFIRDRKLDMFTTMRSNDAYLGLPHDIFAFTMIQEIIARSLGVDVGVYTHAVGSMHLYEKHLNVAKRYLDEGYQSTLSPMPEMPNSDPWKDINKLIKYESLARNGKTIEFNGVDDYWKDLVRLLQVHNFCRNNDYANVRELKPQVSKYYHPYIDLRLPDQ